MLVLTRKVGQRIKIGNNIIVTVVTVSSGGLVRIGVEAPRDITVLREEVPNREAPE